MINSLLSDLTRHQKLLLASFILVKVSLLFLLPLTGDEAYFIQWGKNLAWGYYDHPPMVGWTIWGLSFVSDDLIFFRFFAFFTSIIIGLYLYQLLLHITIAPNARLISLAYFISPISLFSVLLANDVVLTFFGFIGFYYYLKASEKDSVTLALCSGGLLAFAFLSKYLSAMFFIGIFVYSLVNFRKVNWKVSLIVATIVLAAVGENIYFNLQSCWNNILFNLVSRTQNSGLEIKNFFLLLITLLILVSPVGLYQLIKSRVTLNSSAIKIASYICVSYLIVFLVVSLSKTVGLHWFALMLPFVFLLFSRIEANYLNGVYLYAGYFSVLIGALLSSVVVFSESIFDLKRKHRDVAFYLNTEQVCEQLPKEKVIFTTGYSTNSVLAYHCPENTFHVAFDQSKYGREDDKQVNFNEYANQDLWIFDQDDDVVDLVAPYFERLETQSVFLENGTTFILVKGVGFDFEKYKESVLKPVCEQFYSAPDWLPRAKCHFREKYGFGLNEVEVRGKD